MKKYLEKYSKKYLIDLGTTIFLIIVTFILYYLKYKNALPYNLKLFTYLLILSLNFLLFLSMIVHRLKDKTNLLKNLTDTKLNIPSIIFTIILIVIAECIGFYLESINKDPFEFLNVLLDIIAVLSIINALIQKHINYGIYLDMLNNKSNNNELNNKSNNNELNNESKDKSN